MKLLDFAYKNKNIIEPLYIVIFLFFISSFLKNISPFRDDEYSILFALIVAFFIFGFILNPFFNKLTRKINDKRKVFLWHLLFLTVLIILGLIFTVIYAFVQEAKLNS